MGLFLSMSSVVGGSDQELAEALGSILECSIRNVFEPATGDLSENKEARIINGPSGVTVTYPHGFSDWDELSSRLSREMQKPVFSFHIHDGDLWMFQLFVNGSEAIKFNPIPDYWEELPEAGRQSWLPSAEQVTQFVPAATADRLAPYLQKWPEEGLQGKAHPEDEFEFIDWQVVDFMRELGFRYPDPGEGIAYEMTVKSMRVR